MKYFASSNLITDLKFKQQVGVKADAHIEALAIINKNEGENDEIVDLKIQLENRDELQINAKLFVKSFDIDLCLEAVKCLKQAFEVEKIDSLTFSVPAEGIALNQLELELIPSMKTPKSLPSPKPIRRGKNFPRKC